jgi:hypothetical protein
MAELVIAVAGATLLVCGIGANQRWLDRHILPSFLLPRDWYVALQTAARIAVGIAGAWLLVVVRPRVGRWTVRAPGYAGSIALAVGLALAASEPVLRQMQWRPVGWLTPDDEPRRQADARLGWTFVPSRIGHAVVARRDIEYAIDASGMRVRRIDQPVDVERPSLLFIGESVMFGEGLTWEESIPAQVEALTGIQSANLAVHGYGSDQAFMKLQRDLPRFRRPVAVVSLFMTTLFGRNLDHERPHLRAGLIWHPAEQRWRIASLARLAVPYRSDGAIDAGVRLTREILLATGALARTRGAIPLIVLPQFGPEFEAETALRRRILDGVELPVVPVSIDPAWRLPWDRHPDARGARAMAEEIAARLRTRPEISGEFHSGSTSLR